jgi:hypoxia-inducible factor (prolyl hydroxylase)
MDQARLADFVCSELNGSGFCVLNDFLSQNTGKEILCEVKTLDESGTFKDGQLSGGVTASENDEKLTEKRIRGDKITWIEGHESGVTHISELMQRVDSLVMQCNGASKKLGGYDIQGRTKMMVACYPGQRTGYVRHVDNPDGDGRCLTAIYYLNENWSESDGGKLRMFRGANHIDIEPIFNRLLLFWSDERNPHEVLPANFHRYAATVWYFDKEERREAKELQKHKLMGEFGIEVVIKDLEEKMVERDRAQTKLDEESERLIKSMMSEEELDAMAAMIKYHPSPKDMLKMYGVSPSILDALLKVLEKK